MTDPQLRTLLDKYLTEDLTQDEKLRLQKLLLTDEQRPVFEQYIDDFIKDLQEDQLLENPAMLQEMQEKLALILHEREVTRTAPHVRFLKTTWFKYAAAILIIFGSVAYLFVNNRNGKDQASTTGNNQLQTDITPGGEKAVLTLADGRKIVLDIAANGKLANQGGVEVIKLANGKIAYNLQRLTSKEVQWNTMSTPVGGQYQVTLPDGTKVWLNAASSITFPTAFTGKKRAVKIRGEIYFEVAKNKQSPFIVDIDGKSSVEVLGTSFNVNSYADEGVIKTTLLEGSVKLINAGQVVILKPGQQATSAEDISVRSNVDIDQTLAWKNGLFNFNGLNVREVMRQLERWYDIKVKFEGDVSSLTFKGEMFRDVNLSDVLEMFQKLEVKFRMEGKTLIVTGE